MYRCIYIYIYRANPECFSKHPLPSNGETDGFTHRTLQGTKARVNLSVFRVNPTLVGRSVPALEAGDGGC